MKYFDKKSARYDGKKFWERLSKLKEQKMPEENSIKVMHFEGSDHEIGCQFAAQVRNLLFR